MDKEQFILWCGISKKFQPLPEGRPLGLKIAQELSPKAIFLTEESRHPQNRKVKIGSQTMGILKEAIWVKILTYFVVSILMLMSGVCVGATDLSVSGVVKSVAASDSSAWAKARADYVCTGTNDQEVINSALKEVGSNNSVFLAAGTYNIAGPINLAGQRLLGEHRSGNRSAGDKTGGTSLFLSYNGDMIVISVSGSVIENIQLFGNKSKYTTSTNDGIITDGYIYPMWVLNCDIMGFKGHALNLSNAVDPFVIGCIINTCDDYAIQLGPISGHGARILDTRMEFNYGGVRMQGSNTWENKVHNCWFVTHEMEPIRIEAGVRDCWITDSEFVETNYKAKGVIADIYATQATGIRVTNCYLRSQFPERTSEKHTYGIVFSRTPKSAAIGNYIERTLKGGILIDGSPYCTVTDNTLINTCQDKNNTYSAIKLQANTENSHHCVVSGNIILEDGTNKAKYGIEETDTNQDNNEIHGNVIDGPITAK